MLRQLSDKEIKQHRKELKDFCEENHCLMYNFMKTIKEERYNAKNKVVDVIDGSIKIALDKTYSGDYYKGYEKAILDFKSNVLDKLKQQN